MLEVSRKVKSHCGMKQLEEMGNAELSEVFAVEIAGWTRGEAPMGMSLLPTSCWINPFPFHGEPYFANSVDNCYPYLERHSQETYDKRGGEPDVFRLYSPSHADDMWTVQRIYMHHDSDVEETAVADKSLARAICIALIKAKRGE